MNKNVLQQLWFLSRAAGCTDLGRNQLILRGRGFLKLNQFGTSFGKTNRKEINQ